MAKFVVEQEENGKVRQIFRDGEPYKEALKLEQVYSIVTVYFQLAGSNFSKMEFESKSDDRRQFGLQSFLMSLTALEAFTNTYFHLRSIRLGRDDILKRIEKQSSLSKKLSDLVMMTGDGPLIDQDRLINEIFKLSERRHGIVHPKWVPSGVTMLNLGSLDSIAIEGLVESPHAIFENIDYCRKALAWSLLAVARVAQGAGKEDIQGFMFHWTGFNDCSIESLLNAVELA